MPSNQIPPVLLLAYRREDTTRQVIDALREVQAPRIFFVVDGPREGEETACQRVRDLAGTIDWECDLETKFRKENRGLRDAVDSSISWFFDRVESGIILEDDCVPSPDFFPYCYELLAQYRDDPRVMHISGNNHDRTPFSDSYRFSRYPHIWGWATWARAWHTNHPTTNSLLKTLLADRCSKAEQIYWLLHHDCVSSGKIDTWDYHWLFSILAQNGQCITPRTNLVTNVGFGIGATHTTQKDHLHANADIGKLPFPLIHPKVMRDDSARDIEVANRLYRIGASAKTAHLKLRLTKMLPTAAKDWLKNRLIG